MSVSGTRRFGVEILLSDKAGLTHVQLAGEMIAANAAINIWYAEKLLGVVPGVERDKITDPIVELEKECRRAWASYRDQEDPFSGAGSDALVRAQERLITAMWNVLPPEYRPHPIARQGLV
ncbi:hypothetical protein [Micromonospora pisi]|uniref:hypothetical protein n=1 Tax=Micromonospora pisi TaxID=589240 RepID=UPI0011C3FB52|nr:hypothetical protein [Micromonospora pisi]